MKNIPLSFLIIMGLFATGQLTAQDVPATEVDRILSEIEMETPAVEEAVTEAVVEDPVVEEAGAEMVEETVTVEPVEVADPTTVPAINLEEVVDVEGLEIRGSDSGTQGLITLSYEDVKLADMVRIFAQTSGANIIIPEGMDELVSGNLNDVFWLEALEVILGDKGYVLVARKSDIYTISSRDQMATEPLASETLDLQFITAEAALPAIQSMIVSSNASVTPIPQTNVLIISETPERIQEIKRLVKLVDRPRRQVFIEAKFVELNDSAIKDLGINWQVLQGYTVRATGLTSEYERTDTRSTQDAQALLTTRQNAGSRTNNFIDPLLNTDISTSSQNQLNALVQGKNFDTISATTGAITTVPSMEEMVTKNAILSADDFALTLSALQQLDGTRIVSNPKMLVANGETATIHVGRNEPNVRAIPQGDNASSYAYVLDGFIEIGVKLEVTPIISTDKNITISIIPELSRLIGQKEVGEAGTSFPITQIRKINTEFAVESGKTVAIGGLTQTEDVENVKKIPLLGDLPIIGKYLFTHTSTKTIQDEIIIFVTVDAMLTTDMNDSDGIPEQGSLIYSWLNHQEAARKKKAEEKLTQAGIISAPTAVVE
jgi:type IV pilus assembly protein PilQ